jgi:hypothetical protein
MHKHTIKYERFVISIFTAHAGEERIFTPVELSRGLTTAAPIAHFLAEHEDARPLHSFSIFTRGSWAILRGDLPPLLMPAGSGGNEVARFPDNYRSRALEDDCEYHCVTPRGQPVYWQRRLISHTAGSSLDVFPGEFVYVASGTVALRGHTFIGPAMIEVANPGALEIIESTIGVKMWL